MFSQVHFFDILHARLLWTTPSLDNEKLSVVIQAYTKKQLASEPSPPNTKEWFNDGIFRRLWSLLPLFDPFCPFLPFSTLFATFCRFLSLVAKFVTSIAVVTLFQVYLFEINWALFVIFYPFWPSFSLVIYSCQFW